MGTLQKAWHVYRWLRMEMCSVDKTATLPEFRYISAFKWYIANRINPAAMKYCLYLFIFIVLLHR
jgi:hypothetical protein